MSQQHSHHTDEDQERHGQPELEEDVGEDEVQDADEEELHGGSLELEVHVGQYVSDTLQHVHDRTDGQSDGPHQDVGSAVHEVEVDDERAEDGDEEETDQDDVEIHVPAAGTVSDYGIMSSADGRCF